MTVSKVKRLPTIGDKKVTLNHLAWTIPTSSTSRQKNTFTTSDVYPKNHPENFNQIEIRETSNGKFEPGNLTGASFMWRLSNMTEETAGVSRLGCENSSVKSKGFSSCHLENYPIYMGGS